MATNPTDIAFGFSETEYFDERPIGSTVYPGLTKREYFAAVALQGLLSMDDWRLEDAAAVAADAADALIAALNAESQANS